MHDMFAFNTKLSDELPVMVCVEIWGDRTRFELFDRIGKRPIRCPDTDLVDIKLAVENETTRRFPQRLLKEPDENFPYDNWKDAQVTG